ncbi:MAG: hypothetical protein K8R48_00440 [Alphaproteobacteria bacterium]|nr:hypothetical protein [Alphaproteobacteria bacterium]
MAKSYDDFRTTTTTNMDELKEKLLVAFDKAFANGERESLGEIAKGIAAVEREQREAKERGINKLEKN